MKSFRAAVCTLTLAPASAGKRKICFIYQLDFLHFRVPSLVVPLASQFVILECMVKTSSEKVLYAFIESDN